MIFLSLYFPPQVHCIPSDSRKNLRRGLSSKIMFKFTTSLSATSLARKTFTTVFVLLAISVTAQRKYHFNYHSVYETSDKATAATKPGFMIILRILPIYLYYIQMKHVSKMSVPMNFIILKL